MKAESGGLVIDWTKFFSGHAELVAADAEGDDGFAGALPRGFENTGGGLGAELAGGVKDIVDAQTAIFERFCGAKDRFEVRFGALLAQKHHTNGDGDFGVDHALGEELFTKIASDQGIVLGIAEKCSDPLERFQELHEVLVGVSLANFAFSDSDAMARGECADDERSDRTFEMKVQLCFGMREDALRKHGRRGAISVRQSGLAGVGPSGKPVGADVGGGVGELVDERGGGLIVEAVEVFVVVGLYFEMGVAVGKEHRLEQTVGTEAGVEGVVGGIVDKGSVVGAHGEKGRETVDEGGAEALVNAGLSSEVAIEIVGGVKGIVGFGDIKSQDGGVEFDLIPVAEFHGFGKFLAIDADFPGEQASGVELGFAELADGGFVAAGERFKREASVFIEANEVIVSLRRIFRFGFEGIANVLQEEGAIVLEIDTKIDG